MKDELQGKLIEILSSIQSGVGQAKDFALSQLPDIAQSYVVFGRAEAVAHISLTLAMVVAFFFCVAKAQKQNDSADSEVKATTVAGMFASGISGLLLGMSLMFEVSGYLMVWFAPKVWLLKEIAYLVK